jgi:hypothetical protein
LKDCATDWEKFTVAKEADANNKSHCCSICLRHDSKEVVFELQLLNVNQLQQLCKNGGVVSCRNSTKYSCHVLIANYFAYQKSLKEQGLSHQTHKQQTTSTILCAIDVVLSNNFIVDILAISNCKYQVDHKMGTTHKDFYIHACDAHNTCDEGSLELLGQKWQQQQLHTVDLSSWKQELGGFGKTKRD